jgi:hypothetical protein
MSKNLNTKIGKVRAFLEEGNTITSWEAIKMFNYTRLADGIHSLINDYGLAIESKMVYEDDGVKYAKYWLTADPKIKAEIKDFLLRGNRLTEESAKEVFECGHLKVVINELREEGMNILCETVHPLCGKKFNRYYFK